LGEGRKKGEYNNNPNRETNKHKRLSLEKEESMRGENPTKYQANV